MTKLEELKTTREAACDAADVVFYAAYEAICDARISACDARDNAYTSAEDSYYAELKKTQQEKTDD